MMRSSLVIVVSCFALLLLGCEERMVSPEAASPEALSTGEVDPGLQQGAAKSGHVLNFTAPLSGRQEVPPVATNATGLAKFQLNEDGTALSYKLIVANIEDVLMAHIHLGEVGQNGGVVVWLYPDAPPPMLIPGTSNGVLAEGTITADDLTGALEGQPLGALIDAMADQGAYVNVHTTENPGGEIRGQIVHGNGVR